jgi:hypothetical protein
MLEEYNYASTAFDSVSGTSIDSFTGSETIEHIFRFSERPCPCVLLKSSGVGGSGPTMTIKTLKNPKEVGEHRVCVFPMV